MKIKLDENLPKRLVAMLRTLGHDADTVQAEGLTGRTDEVVLAAARKGHRLLITQDVGVGDVRKLARGQELGVILIRLRDPGRDRLVDRVGEVFQRHDIEQWESCIVVVTERKIRVRKLSS